MTSEMTTPEQAAAATVQRRLDGLRPRVAVVLGSGLGGFAARVRSSVRIPYADIPHFPQTTVAGHGGELVAGVMGEVPVLVQSGRFHMYEGHTAERSALPVRVFAALGVETVVLTNAAGGVHGGMYPGAIMLIADHLNLTGRNPLVGPVRAGEVRFPGLANLYDVALRGHVREAARRRGMVVPDGVYAGVLGPSYETPAEIRMLERLGADAVGMSTVVEAIAAAAAGLRCLGLSVITNYAGGVAPGATAAAATVSSSPDTSPSPVSSSSPSMSPSPSSSSPSSSAPSLSSSPSPSSASPSPPPASPPSPTSPVAHLEVLAAAEAAVGRLGDLLEEVITTMPPPLPVERRRD